MDKKLSIEVKGLGKGLLLTLVLGLLVTPLIYFTGIKETIMPTLGNLIMAVGIFYCSCYVSKAHGSKGLVRGISMGLVFFIFMLIATIVFNSSLISFKTFLYTLSLCLIAGSLGGILGIGLSDQAI
ncbi:MAG TPA: TIGR04086 family membrane protein [Gelria sp.]|jgi:putative membrane protein (TIGR04086 family)|nr:TIGR04086 family membrane protein [Gelria sp.]